MPTRQPTISRVALWCSALLCGSALLPACRAHTSGAHERSLVAPPLLGWSVFDATARKSGRALGEELRSYLAVAKTRRLALSALAAQASSRGAVELAAGAPLAPGKIHFWRHRGEALAVVRPGARPLAEGLTLYVFPLDAPRLELKPAPEKALEQHLFLQARASGHLDLARWMSVPLALHGAVAAADGLRFVSIGETERDPVLVIPDILPHLARGVQRHRIVGSDTLRALAVGPTPDVVSAALEGAALRGPLLAMLREKGVAAPDFVSGEWTLVPADPPQWLGIDRGLLAGYAQSQRTLGYVALRSLLAKSGPSAAAPRAQLLLFVPRSLGASGGESLFFVRHALGRFLEAAGAGDDLTVARVRAKSRAFVAGSAGGLLGKGIALNPSRDDAGPAQRRAVLDVLHARQVPFQLIETAGGRSDARILTTLDFATIELALPATATGRPMEVTSFFDVLAAERLFRALAEL